MLDPSASGVYIDKGGRFEIDHFEGFARLMKVGFRLTVNVRGNELHLGAVLISAGAVGAVSGNGRNIGLCEVELA